VFIKISRSGKNRYVQLVQAYRDGDTGRPKQRTVATLGRLDQLDTSLKSVISGLLRVTGQTLAASSPPTLSFDSARDFGDVWTLTELWNALGFDGLRTVFGHTRHSIDVEALIRVMVFNRLCEPDSKLGVLRWLETVALPDTSLQTIDHQHLLRAMDALVEHKAEVDNVMASLLRPLVDQDLAMVFYDMTTIRAAGLSEQEGDLRHFGMAKVGVVERQVMLGVVQTAEGLPLYHEVFEGKTAEVTTIKGVVEKIVARFPINRVIAVADRGLLSTENLADLQDIVLPGGNKLEFILAVPGRRYGDFVELLEPFHSEQCLPAKQEILGETTWNKLRLIIAHDPQVSQVAGVRRDKRIDELKAQADQWVGKLNDQDDGKKKPGRKLSDGGARAKFYREVCEAHLARIVKVDLKSELFTYDIDERALKHAKMMDGKLLLVTNAPDFAPDEVIKRYKSLADIERGFRVLKYEIEIGPIYHRLPDRIHAHASICFMALILYRVMRSRLKDSHSQISPERALDKLRRIQHQVVKVNDLEPIAALSSINQEHTEILQALTIKKPTLPAQLTLL
jgi:hypothetical protein